MLETFSERTKGTRSMTQETQDGLNRRLIFAIERKDTSSCISLMAAGADPNGDVGSDGEVMLTRSIRKGDIFTSLCLLSHGALPSAKSINHEVPVSIAALERSAAEIKILVEHGAQVDQITHCQVLSALQSAASGANERICRALLEVGAAVNGIDRRGMSALHCAVRTFDDPGLATCRLLVAAGADINLIAPPPTPILNPMYLSPFQDAVSRGKLEHVQFFVEECGASLGQRTHAGQTLLEIATTREVKEFLRSAMTKREIAHAIGDDEPAPQTKGFKSFGPL
jgi:ankyrin repeat protein